MTLMYMYMLHVCDICMFSTDKDNNNNNILLNTPECMYKHVHVV